MNVWWFSQAFALDISISFVHNTDIQEWSQRYQQQFALQLRSTIPLEKAQKLQQRAPQSVSLERMYRLSIEETQKKDVLYALSNDSSIEWYFPLSTVLPPPPIDPTPDYLPLQEYLYFDPGMDIISFWNDGIFGSSVRIADVEYGWELSHEDLQDAPIFQETEYPMHPDVQQLGYDEHGTAVLGITSSVDNGFGCTGIAHQSEILLFTEYPEQGWDRSFAMMRAIEQLSVGDVLLLEMQDYAGCEASTCLGPAEINPEVWTWTRFAVDAGIIVVAASGNGILNIDQGWYATNYVPLGDSGAIMVGAGLSLLGHGWGGLTSGSRIDIQAWGYNVMTLGYTTKAEFNHDPTRTYTESFSGTSSSSALVAGAVALLQEWNIQETGHPLLPEGMRRLLHDSGEASTNFVPHINIQNARLLLQESDYDGDGFFVSYYGGQDCNDADASIHPLAEEIWYDGIDQNCDGRNDYDQDADGFSTNTDCDDLNPEISPAAVDTWYDGIDQNCDGVDDFDQDGDGYVLAEDCDDLNPEISPAAVDTWYDGIDQNCDGVDDFDQDGDGYVLAEDCDDENPSIYPSAKEINADGIDQNCNGEDPNFFGCALTSQTLPWWLIVFSVLCVRRKQ